MILVGILAFLIGGVLAWGYRVLILIPLTTSLFLAVLGFEMVVEAPLWSAVQYALMVWLAPQAGFAFGLFARSSLAGLRRPQKAVSANLFQQARAQTLLPSVRQRN